MRFLKWIKVLLQGGRCLRCRHYYKPYRFYDVGYCTRWATKIRFDSDRCADFKEMERMGK